MLSIFYLIIASFDTILLEILFKNLKTIPVKIGAVFVLSQLDKSN